MNRPRKSDLAKHWSLDPNISFLNHGSFGAVPIAVQKEQQRIRDIIETEPVRFFERQYIDLLNTARKSLADFIQADVNGMTFVPNATSGVNTVLRSLSFKPGDEILVPDHAYQACRNAVEFAAERSGAKTVVVPIPFRAQDEDEIINLIMDAVTDRTVLAMIDTVTSPTGMRMPFERLTKKLQDVGVDVLLDAAHGPGIVPLNLQKLNAAYVTGNCHKWLCTPKGSAFLHIHEDKKPLIRPLTISHGASFIGDLQEKFEFEFGWTGTIDPSPFLCIPAAIEHLGGLVENGWDGILTQNRTLALKGRAVLCEALDTIPPFPDSMIASLASVELPLSEDIQSSDPESDTLHNILFDRYGIQIPVFPWTHHGVRYIRLSAQLYNHEDEYRFLAKALREGLGLG